ncbi:sodium/glucose cotransporter 5-like [Acropora millepora]|uniref:sodium/glucose cotransporter 5-like n=1 Tax=Acropora millepora TaxID=45264 RepID=UPI001CF41053|nr:sodium/glucose cotransporter 5-like [Acropora millepora]
MTLDESSKSLHVADWVIIAVYFLGCLVVGLWSKFRKTRLSDETAETYFLAGRSMMWWAVGPSLFASNIGSEHFVGLAGSGAATGIGVVSYEWQACWILLLLGWVFVPIYLRSRVFTMPEFLQKRFQSQWIRTYLTAVALISYVFTKTSVDIYAGSVFLYEAVGWNVYISAACILAITAVYTLLGGLTAVIYTDVLQCTIMILGAIVLAILSFVKVGGYDALWEGYGSAVGKSVLIGAQTMVANSTNSTMVNGTMGNGTMGSTNISSGLEACFKLTPEWGHMFRPIDDPDYPWLGLWTTLPIMGVWYWCTDQVIVQRVIGAKTNVQAKAGSILAGFLKILPIFIMVMPGMIARVLFPDSIACPDPESCLKHCGNEWGCTNNAYPKLVLNVLPVGLVGLMMAVMMAALMSSLSSAFNSSSTIFTVDVWLRFRPQAGEREQLIVGRIVVVLLVIVSICWLPIIQGSAGTQLFVYIQTIQSYLAPPITMVFGLGILWTGLTSAGALSGLLIGFVLGMAKFIAGNVYTTPKCGDEDTRPGFAKMHFMFYAIIIFVVSGTVMVVVSFFTKKVPLNELGGLTWKTIGDPPISHGAIGEIDCAEKAENGGVHTEAVELLEKKGALGPTTHIETSLDGNNTTNAVEQHFRPNAAVNEESNVLRLVTNDKVRLTVVQFEREDPVLKWFLRIMSVLLIVCLAFLWIFYR